MNKSIFLGLLGLTGCFGTPNDSSDVGVTSNRNNNLVDRWYEHPRPDPSEPQKSEKKPPSYFEYLANSEQTLRKMPFTGNQEPTTFPNETFSKQKEEFEKLYRNNTDHTPRITE